MNRILVSSLVLLLSLTGLAHAEGDAAAGRNKAIACGGCHGMDGNSMVETFPKLAGQNEKYIAKQLMDFKTNTTRQNALMLGFAMALTEQDAADIGAYFASQALPSGSTHDESKLSRGREVYKGGNLQTGVPACQGCHGPTGAGNAMAAYPQLGGQHVNYTISQLNAFHSAARANDTNQVMRTAVKAMTAAEIDAVAHYIASLK